MDVDVYVLPRSQRPAPWAIVIMVALLVAAGFGATEGHTQFTLVALAMAAVNGALAVAVWWSTPYRIELAHTGVTLHAPGRDTRIPWPELTSVALVQGRWRRLKWVRANGRTEDIAALCPTSSGYSPRSDGGRPTYGSSPDAASSTWHLRRVTSFD